MAGNGEAVVVLGGGIVGLCTALALQDRGVAVTLVDRDAPGEMTSSGNTGVLVENPWLGLASPGLWRRLPGLLAGRSPVVRVAPGFALRRPALMARLLAASLRRDALVRTLALHALVRRSQRLHLERIAQAGAGDLLRRTGWLKLFRTPAGMAAHAAERALWVKTRTAHRTLTPADLAGLEPGLRPGLAGGVLLEDAASVSSPLALSRRYLALFLARGGRVERLAVTALRHDGGPWALHHAGGRLDAGRVVLAAGPWSADLLRPLGLDVPLFWERGYHLHLTPGAGPGPLRPIHDVERGYVMTPQAQGVRVTSGVELAHRDAAPDRRQVDAAAAAARDLAGLGPPVEAEPWLGSRPSLPDGLPAIGAAPGLPGLWLNFGHHHIGLSLAPGSAEMLAGLMAAAATPAATAPDPAPFDPARLVRPARPARPAAATGVPA
jgi:D-amino-acid dehydrogenase